MEFHEFRLTIQDRRDIRISMANGELPQKFDVRIDRLAERTIDVFRHWLEEDKIKTREELVVLGTHLFNVLFDTKARELFRREYDKISCQSGSGLRVVLEFQSDARDLAVFPWEYIYYPDSASEGEGRGFFIAADSQLILARHVPLTPALKNLSKSPKPLRILIVVSKPESDSDGKPLGIVQAEKTIQKIRALKNVLGEGIEVDEFPNLPTKKNLTEFIQKSQPYHVLHFIGHGKYDKEGYLALVNSEDPRKAFWIKDDDLADSLRKRAPRLIFLHACEGGSSDSYAGFRGVALKLVYSDIPAVVAMQYEVKNSVAAEFANKFYESLGSGMDVDVAVQDGRRALGGMFSDQEENYSNRAFGSPVVYLQTAQGIVIASAKEESAAKETASRTNKTTPCPYDNCDRSVKPGQRYCTGCGGELIVCSKCGGIIAKGGKFCPGCGRVEQSGAGVIKLSASIDGGDKVETGRIGGAKPGIDYAA